MSIFGVFFGGFVLGVIVAVVACIAYVVKGFRYRK
jgi:hypothetical protein